MSRSADACSPVEFFGHRQPIGLGTNSSRERSTYPSGDCGPRLVFPTPSPWEDLVCYLMNLADDLQAWVAQGVVPPEVLVQVPRELRKIAEALETRAPVSSRQEDQERRSDDEIPF